MDQIGPPDGGAGDATGDTAGGRMDGSAGGTAAPDRPPDPAGTTPPGVEAAEAVELEPVQAVVGPADDEAPATPVRASSASRALGYLAAAIAGGAIVLAALAVTGRIGPGAEPVTSPSPSSSAAVVGASPPASAGTGAVGASPSASAGTGVIGAAPVLGDPAAPILVEIWADYQCPYCGILTHAMEGALLRDYVDTGRIRLAYRDFAFLGQESLEAAAAARCAGEQGAYWRYHDLLFASQQGENQGAFASQNLLSLAGFAGLDREAFATCMNDSAVRAAVAADTEAGGVIGVTSTPSVYVVGPKGATLLKGVPGFTALDAAILEVTTGIKPSPPPSPSPSPSAAGSAAPATSPGASPATGTSAAPATSPGAATPGASPAP
ncbi:MAG: thioredoxin domain-containing protein [Chloroflexota bacterium]